MSRLKKALEAMDAIPDHTDRVKRGLELAGEVPDEPGSEERWIEVEKRLDRHAGEKRIVELESAIVEILDAFEYQNDRLTGCVYGARENLKKVMGLPTIEDRYPVPQWVKNRREAR